MLMSRFLTLCASVTLMAASSSVAQPTASEILALNKGAAAGGFVGRAEWLATTYYLQGAVEAFGTVNGSGSERLFCAPLGKSYSIQEMIGYLERAPRGEHSKPALTVILAAYQDEFPCQ